MDPLVLYLIVVGLLGLPLGIPLLIWGNRLTTSPALARQCGGALLLLFALVLFLHTIVLAFGWSVVTFSHH